MVRESPEKLLPISCLNHLRPLRTGAAAAVYVWQVKRVAAGLDGSVSAENRKKGGARFMIRLPLAAGVGRFKTG